LNYRQRSTCLGITKPAIFLGLAICDHSQRWKICARLLLGEHVQIVKITIFAEAGEKGSREAATLTKSGRLFQIVRDAIARDAITVFTRCGTISKSELDKRSVLADLYESK